MPVLCYVFCDLNRELPLRHPTLDARAGTPPTRGLLTLARESQRLWSAAQHVKPGIRAT